MIPTLEEHNLFIAKLFGIVEPQIQLYIASGNSLIGKQFARPVQHENGWTISPESPVDVIINWDSTFSNIFGYQLESLHEINSFMSEFAKYYENQDTSPLKVAGNTNIAYELKRLLVDIYSKYSNPIPSYSLPPLEQIATESYEYLTKSTETLIVEAPICGLVISKPLRFSIGEICPLSFDDKVKYARDSNSSYRQNFQDIQDILQLDAILKLTFVIPRENLNSFSFVQAPAKQISNLLLLLKLYEFSGLQEYTVNHFIGGISRRFLMGSPSVATNFFVPKIAVENEQDLTQYIDQHLKLNLDDSPISFIVARINEAWSKSRNEAFKVFDYVSVLEALLTPSNDGELRFKVSSYAAFYLGTNADERKAISKLIKRAYVVRSYVAHCKSKIKPQEMLTREEINELGKIVHKFVRKVLEIGIDQFRIEIEEQYFNAGLK